VPRRIVVLLHERQSRQPRLDYAIVHMAELWRQAGHDVRFLFGVREFVPADVAIVHVDLSVVPDEYLDFARRYPVTLNGAVKDIRKSVISTSLVTAGDAYSGPVIVKSNLNYSGLPERLFVAGGIPIRMQLGNVSRSLWRLGVGRRPSRFTASDDYRIYPSTRDVPAATFASPDLVVEKFLPEREGGFYHTRFLTFLGDRVSCHRVASKSPIVKPGSMVGWTEVEPHAEVMALRLRLRFDYVLHDGRPVVLDVNKTPGEDRIVDPRIGRMIRHRAAGLDAYLDRVSAARTS
jgi:hypothetical protein